LKGHGFSRAAQCGNRAPALAAEGCTFSSRNLPSGAEARESFGQILGTTEVVPFQSNHSCSFLIHAIALI
jgi:hypothetical protein